MKAIADHGARFVGCNVMYLQDGTRTHFMKFSSASSLPMLPRYEKLYAKKVSRRTDYRKEVQGMVRLLQERYGLGRQTRDASRRQGGADAKRTRWAEPREVPSGFRDAAVIRF